MSDRLLRLLFGRLKVRHPKSVPLLVEFIRASLKEKGFAGAESLPESVAIAIVNEAARRAVEQEKDGSLRSDKLFGQVQAAIDSIMKASAGDAEADPRIRGILEFHKVI